MAKRKKDVYFVGPASYTKEGYDEFTKKSRDEQREIVYNSLYPKDYNEADKILTKVPHGDSGKGVSETTESTDTGNDTGGSGGLSNNKPGSTKPKA